MSRVGGSGLQEALGAPRHGDPLAPSQAARKPHSQAHSLSPPAAASGDGIGCLGRAKTGLRVEEMGRPRPQELLLQLSDPVRFGHGTEVQSGGRRHEGTETRAPSPSPCLTVPTHFK